VGRPTLQLDQDEIFAEVDRVDTSSREIHLRPDDGRNRVVGYSTDARVLYHGREYPIAQLESGDTVSMQVKQDSRGNSYGIGIGCQAMTGETMGQNIDDGVLTSSVKTQLASDRLTPCHLWESKPTMRLFV
jgi:hypothetical protein